MKCISNCEACSGIGLLLARVPLGAILMVAGYRKFTGPGVEGFVTQASPMVPACMPSWFGNVYLHAVPYAEVLLGALLVIGLLTRVSGLLAALMIGSFGIAMGAHGFLDLSPNAQLFQAPFTYGVLALVALFAGPGSISVDRLLFRRK